MQKLDPIQWLILCLSNMALSAREDEYRSDAVDDQEVGKANWELRAVRNYRGADLCRVAAQAMLRRILDSLLPERRSPERAPELRAWTLVIQGILQLDRAEAMRYSLSAIGHINPDDLRNLVRIRTTRAVQAVASVRHLGGETAPLLRFLQSGELPAILWIILRTEGVGELVRETLATRLPRAIERLLGDQGLGAMDARTKAAELAYGEIESICTQLATNPVIAHALSELD